ncbi:hypothetical protein CUMW_233680 [Citrus unshiu]|uniref:Uncharacterized protein n=1 Tax=Citrus unshiu TaxID=55188 RepID=A0A2H5QIJ7_CITUN|nr:hypothetical protein CUMW_233680 [Citrus unshiu]
MPNKECIPPDVLNNETIHLLLQFIHIRNSIKAVEWENFFLLLPGTKTVATLLVYSGDEKERERGISISPAPPKFNLKGCKNIECLPNSISALKFPSTLNFSGLLEFRLFPEIMGRLCSLTKWDLSDCNLPMEGGEIPSDICHICLLFKMNQNLIPKPDAMSAE